MLRLCPLRVHLRWGVPSQAQQPYRLVEFAARRSFQMTTRKRKSGVECAVEDDRRAANGNGEGPEAVAKEVPSESTAAKKRRKSKKEPEPAGPAYEMSMRPEKLDSTMLHVMSWNVAGMRALMKKDAGTLKALVERERPDVLCLQETKLQDSHISDVTKQMGLDGWTAHWSCSQARKGYSGTAVLCRKPPLGVSYGIGASEHDQEGRVISVELPEAHVVNVYVPNAGDGLKRLDYRVGSWDKDFSAYLRKLEESKPVIVAGDMNCAHQEIDIHNPAGNLRSAGFTQEERDSFTDSFLNNGFLDTFRLQHPGVVGYTYYGYRGGMRAKGKGWRLDYLLASQVLRQHLYDSYILTDVMGSDHLPLGLVLKPL